MQIGIGIGPGFVPGKAKRGGAPAPIGLLNTTEGAGSTFAHALRLLNADFIGQDAIEVKRTANSDFDRFKLTADGLPWNDIASFCNASDGVVPWLVDQAGNNYDATQTAEASAPKIYDSATGIVKNTNNLPALFFDGVDDGFNLPDNIYSGTEGILVFTIGDYDASNGSGLLNINGTAGSGAWRFFVTNEIGIRTGGGFATFGAPLAGVSLNAFHKPQSGAIFDIKCFVDGVERSRDDGSDNSMDYGTGTKISYMNVPTIGNYRQGTMTECISYPPEKLNNRVFISQNIINYYGIS